MVLSTVRVERKATGWRDRFRAYTVLVDGVKVGRVHNGGTFEYAVEPGNHRVQMKVGWLGSYTSRELAVDCPPDRPALILTSARPMRLNILAMMPEVLWRRAEYIFAEQQTEAGHGRQGPTAERSHDSQ